MDLRVDHVALGFSNRADMADHLASLGFEPAFGGTHRDGTTEMSLVGFDDGSYLELIGPASDDRPARWPTVITEDGGPAAWAIRVDDVGDIAKRLIDRGVQVHGPIHDHRERPDGLRVEWDHCYVGGPSARHVFPFVIADRTPRSRRVRPTPGVANSPLRGIAEVVVAVENLDATVARLKRIFRLPEPETTSHDAFGARLAHFPGQPLTLATPTGKSWLRGRLDAFGRRPAATLLLTDDMQDARREFPIELGERWFGRRFGTFESNRLGMTLGVVEREA